MVLVTHVLQKNLFESVEGESSQLSAAVEVVQAVVDAAAQTDPLQVVM